MSCRGTKNSIAISQKLRIPYFFHIKVPIYPILAFFLYQNTKTAMKIISCVLVLVLVIQENVAHSHYGLRYRSPKTAMKRHKGNIDARELAPGLPNRRPDRVGYKMKICGGKGKGKAGTRSLFPCVDYGDPGDDPIDRDGGDEALSTFEPSASPTAPPSSTTVKHASGSNKDAGVDLDYARYEASGSNDYKPVYNDRAGDGNSTEDDIESIYLNIGNNNVSQNTEPPMVIDDLDTNENVPLNDGVPSNDN